MRPQHPAANPYSDVVLTPGPTVIVGDALGWFEFGSAGKVAEGKFAERKVAMFVDEVLLNSDITRLVQERMKAVGVVTVNSVAEQDDDIDAFLEVQSLFDGAEIVVAIGGGRVLDLVKLALATAPNPKALSLLKQRSRYGLVSLGADRRAAGQLFVAVPTTFGTGSEASPVAVLNNSGRRRLVHCPGLKPDIVLLHALATESLPGWLVIEGASEILTRLLGVYLSETSFDSLDGVLASMVTAAVKLGNSAKQAIDSNGVLDADLRLELASLSGMSHMDFLNLGRTPYPHRAWYVANELSKAAGVRKMSALSAVLPSAWQQLLEGEERWGSAAKMSAIWAVVRSVTPELDRDPAVGLRQLLSTWRQGGPVALPAIEIESVAMQCVRAWGGTLPMLNGLGVEEVVRVLTSATSPEAETG